MPHSLSTFVATYCKLFRRSGSLVQSVSLPHGSSLTCLFAKRIVSCGLLAIVIQFSGCSDNAASLDGPPPVPPLTSEAPATPAEDSNATAAIQQTQATWVKAENAHTGVSNTAQNVSLQESAAQEGVAPVPQAQEGVLQKAGDLFDRAKSTTGSTAKAAQGAANGAKSWVQDKIGGATDASSAAAGDTLKWATDTFESLKSQGLTTATDTSDWLSQDWKNMESWEYKIITLDQGNNDEKAAALNELGKNGWESYHVRQLDGTTENFYLKKRKESYLRHLPFNDFIKLVPLMQQANQ